MLDLHLALVTLLHMRFTSHIEQDKIELVTLNSLFGVVVTQYLFLLQKMLDIGTFEWALNCQSTSYLPYPS